MSEEFRLLSFSITINSVKTQTERDKIQLSASFDFLLWANHVSISVCLYVRKLLLCLAFLFFRIDSFCGRKYSLVKSKAVLMGNCLSEIWLSSSAINEKINEKSELLCSMIVGFFVASSCESIGFWFFCTLRGREKMERWSVVGKESTERWYKISHAIWDDRKDFFFFFLF